ncbi:hypothetical protein [Hyalangium minutum]|uniref:hypothetical protein n=1 Tax=Hyalangium minutum TaxID=394096 RepID=UPI0012F9809C|nr:hypothetical protein [Hyalangium minutum]
MKRFYFFSLALALLVTAEGRAQAPTVKLQNVQWNQQNVASGSTIQIPQGTGGTLSVGVEITKGKDFLLGDFCWVAIYYRISTASSPVNVAQIYGGSCDFGIDGTRMYVSASMNIGASSFSSAGATGEFYAVLTSSAYPSGYASAGQAFEVKAASQFVMTPASLSLVCGTTAAQRFSVSNPGNIAGVVSYVWDLGSANNGWLYNGSPAPAVITTIAAAIDLTPVCGVAQSDVSATVNTNNAVYGPYRTDVTNSGYPSMFINGPSNLCTTSPYTYSVAGLSCGTSVTWSTNNQNLAAAISNADNTGSVTKGNGYGDVALTALVTGACGNAAVTRTIRAGSNGLSRPYGTLTFETNASTFRTVELVTVTDFYGWTYSTNGLEVRPSVTKAGISGYWSLNEPTGQNSEILWFFTVDNGKTAIMRFNPFAPSGDKVIRMEFIYDTGCGGTGSNSHWFYYKGSSPTGG